MLTHEDLAKQLVQLDAKVDLLISRISLLDKDLAVHKAKTSRFSMLLSVIASLGVTIAALFAKGCF